MEELRVTVKQAAELFNKSNQTIYNWIEAGKLRFVESAKGKIITINDEEMQNIKDYELGVSTPINQNQYVSINDNQEYSKVQSNSNTLNQSQPSFNKAESSLSQLNKIDFDFNLMMEKISELSSKAGKYELLEDKSKELKNDALYWQEKYFEMKSSLDNQINQNQALTIRINELETLSKENAELKEQLEQERTKPFWKKKVL